MNVNMHVIFSLHSSTQYELILLLALLSLVLIVQQPKSGEYENAEPAVREVLQYLFPLEPYDQTSHTEG